VLNLGNTVAGPFESDNEILTFKCKNLMAS
jgi:hypothetical protein